MSNVSIVESLMSSVEALTLRPECRDALELILDAAVNGNPLRAREAVKLLRLAADLYEGVPVATAYPRPV